MSVEQDDILEVAVTFANDVSGDQMNRFQLRKEDVGSASEADVLDDIADILETIYTIIVSMISLRNVLQDVRVYNVTQDVLVGNTDAGTFIGGTGANPPSAQGVAFQTYFPTDVPRVVLSKYWPSVVQASITGEGLVSAARIANLTTICNLMVADFVEANGTYRYGYLSPKTLSFVVPEEFVVPAIPAYQRRRKPGRGS